MAVDLLAVRAGFHRLPDPVAEVIKDIIGGKQLGRRPFQEGRDAAPGITGQPVVNEVDHPPVLGKKGAQLIQQLHGGRMNRVECGKVLPGKGQTLEGTLQLVQDPGQPGGGRFFLMHQPPGDDLLHMCPRQLKAHRITVLNFM